MTFLSKVGFLPILGNGRGQKRGFPKELGIQLFFMMLGDHIQCISEEISFIGFCLTFSAIIGWIISKVRSLTLIGPQELLKKAYRFSCIYRL